MTLAEFDETGPFSLAHSSRVGGVSALSVLLPDGNDNKEIPI